MVQSAPELMFRIARLQLSATGQGLVNSYHCFKAPTVVLNGPNGVMADTESRQEVSVFIFVAKANFRV